MKRFWIICGVFVIGGILGGLAHVLIGPPLSWLFVGGIGLFTGWFGVDLAERYA